MAYSGEQISMFDLLEDLKDPFPQSDIDKALLGGPHRDRIYSKKVSGFFSEKHTQKEKEEFLKKHWGTGGCYPAFACKDRDKEFGIDFSCKGVRIWRVHPRRGFEMKKIPVSEVARRISKFVQEGKCDE